MPVLAVKQELQQRKRNLRCGEVKSLLEELGFTVRDGRNGGHKVFVHQGLPEFMGGSFNCGHGRNPEIKPAYITKIIRVIEQHEEALREYLGE